MRKEKEMIANVNLLLQLIDNSTQIVIQIPDIPMNLQTYTQLLEKQHPEAMKVVQESSTLGMYITTRKLMT